MQGEGNLALPESRRSTLVDASAIGRSGRHPNHLAGEILKTLLYFDLFSHPLRLHEIDRFLPSKSNGLVELQEACASSCLGGGVASRFGLYYLEGRPESIATDRLKKERRARHMRLVARFVASIVSAMPFVRGVFLSGELSKGVAAAGGDIDFYIVTAARRVWIVRTLCTFFKKAFLFNQKKFFCYNHIVSEEHLETIEHNLYTAIEIVTLVPLKNEALWEEVQRANAWTKEFLPNHPSPPGPQLAVRPAVPLLERVVRRAFGSSTLDRLDYWLLSRWSNAWERRYPILSPEERAKLFHCSAHLSTAYARDYPNTLLEKYDRSLREHGLNGSENTTRQNVRPATERDFIRVLEALWEMSSGNDG